MQKAWKRLQRQQMKQQWQPKGKDKPESVRQYLHRLLANRRILEVLKLTPTEEEVQAKFAFNVRPEYVSKLRSHMQDHSLSLKDFSVQSIFQKVSQMEKDWKTSVAKPVFAPLPATSVQPAGPAFPVTSAAPRRFNRQPEEANPEIQKTLGRFFTKEVVAGIPDNALGTRKLFDFLPSEELKAQAVYVFMTNNIGFYDGLKNARGPSPDQAANIRARLTRWAHA